MKLDEIGLADQPKPVAPQRQGTLDPNARLDLVTRRIHQMKHGLPARRMDVVGECLFQMDRPALARAVSPVPERGEGDRVSTDTRLTSFYGT